MSNSPTESYIIFNLINHLGHPLIIFQIEARAKIIDYSKYFRQDEKD